MINIQFIYPNVCTYLEDRFPTFSESCNRFDRFFYFEICKELNFYNFVMFVINIIYVQKFYIFNIASCINLSVQSGPGPPI